MKVLLAYNLTHDPGTAYLTAKKFIQHPDDELILMYVSTYAYALSSMEADPVSGSVVDPVYVQDQLEDNFEVLEKRLNDAVIKCQNDGIIARGILARGVPEDEIIKEAESNNVDFIAVGYHANHLFTGGALAKELINHSSLPVLVIPSEESF